MTLEDKQAEMKARTPKAKLAHLYRPKRPTKLFTPRIHPGRLGGIVYIVGCSARDWYKIGISRTPVHTKRIYTLSNSVPFDIDVRELWPFRYARAIEERLHKDYNHCRLNGEWFEFTAKQRDNLIKRLNRMCNIYAKPENIDSEDTRLEYRLSADALADQLGRESYLPQDADRVQIDPKALESRPNSTAEGT